MNENVYRDLSFFLREQRDLLLDIRQSVLALRRALEKKVPGFSQAYDSTLQDLAADESVRPNLTRLKQHQQLFSSLERL